MRKFYQKEWFNIPFSSFSDLSLVHLPSPIFYQQFYSVFYQRYSSYQDLPDSYLHSKSEIANCLSTFLPQKDPLRLLSIGSGNCRVESFLLDQDPRVSITAIEPFLENPWAPQDSRFQFIQGLFPHDIPKSSSFDVAFLGNIDYCFTNSEFSSLLKAIRDYPIPICVVSTSSVRSFTLRSTLSYLKLRLMLFLKRQKSGYQLWGYTRSQAEWASLIYSSGWKVDSMRPAGKEFLYFLSPL